MSDKVPFDVAEAFRSFLNQWESMINSIAGQTMSTTEFSRTLNQAGNFSVSGQSALMEASARFLSALNLPTRTDIIAIAERLRSVESKLDIVLSTMNVAENAVGTRTKPTRNRVSPDAEKASAGLIGQQS